MTIAACYLSGEGVVLGADSTTTMFVPAMDPGAPGADHHYNFAQKIFQVGDDSTLAIAMWGLGNLPNVSYRTLIAQFADSLIGEGVQSMSDVANRWNRFFWDAYSTEASSVVQRARQLRSQTSRTPDEERELNFLTQAFSGGFCVGRYLMTDRRPAAFEVLYEPALAGPRSVEPLAVGATRFWGCPNLIDRLVFGLDDSLFARILRSDKWAGTPEDLFNLVRASCLGQPRDLPIREAIDWVHASIYTTIKTMKFSHMAPACGGPVEVAAITTDRKFRWVRHKGFDAAIGEGGLFDVYRDRR